MALTIVLAQEFPTWGTCTSRDTFAYLKGVHLLYSRNKLTSSHENGVYLHSFKNLKVILKIQWIFVIL